MIVTRHIAWFSGLLAMALLLLVLARTPVAADAEGHLGALVAPVTSAVRDVIRPITDVALHAGQISELAAENADLRQQLSRAEADLATLRESRIAVEQAAALVASVGADAGRTVTATVILRDPAPGRQSLVLNRGRTDGVRVGQPVLGTGATLLGTVTEVNETRARVRLITDRDSAVAAVLQSSRTHGSLVGDGSLLYLDFVPVDSSVAPGDVVLSSALGGLLPPGLLIGRVATVDAPGQALFQQITVDPLANIERVEQVLVMIGFQPGLALDTPTAGSTP